MSYAKHDSNLQTTSYHLSTPHSPAKPGQMSEFRDLLHGGQSVRGTGKSHRAAAALNLCCLTRQRIPQFRSLTWHGVLEPSYEVAWKDRRTHPDRTCRRVQASWLWLEQQRQQSAAPVAVPRGQAAARVVEQHEESRTVRPSWMDD